MIYEAYSFLCVFPFFHRIDSSFVVPTSLYASIVVNKAAKRAQIKFRLQPSFYDKTLQSYKKFRTNTSIIFSFFYVFLGVLDEQFCKADSNC